MPNNIFISYRRDDAAPYAGRIADHLNELVGSGRVFMDVEDIEPGQNFADAIDQTLSHCSAVLVIVGARWLAILRERATLNQEDYVVHEIAAALKRKAQVVPVFVGGATAAALTGLPAELAELPFHQGVEIRDSCFKDDCDRLARSLRLTRGWRAWKWVPWAAVPLAALLFIGITAQQRQARLDPLFKIAAVQTAQDDYPAAVDSYQRVLAIDPANARALDRQVDAAMLWAENFHVLAGEGEKAEDIAAPPLKRLKAILQSGMARTPDRTTRAADILAHLGWVHWLNEKIAFQEFGEAEAFWRKSLAIDSANVYANAMLGNWLLQTRGDGKQALRYLEAAVATGKQRPWVRRMQLGGLRHNYDPGMPEALLEIQKQMGANSEPPPPSR